MPAAPLPLTAFLVAALAVAAASAATPAPAAPAPARPAPPAPAADPENIPELDLPGGLAAVVPGSLYRFESSVRSVDSSGSRGRPLRCIVSFPPDFKPDQPRHLVLILPPAGESPRWGHLALPHAAFAPGAITLAVQGPSVAADGTHAFRSLPRDAALLRDITLDATRRLPTRRVFVFGAGESAAAALNAGGQYPRLFDGVVAHAPTRYPGIERLRGLLNTPVCLVHGALGDPAVVDRTRAAFDEYQSARHPALVLRRLRLLDDRPDPHRASEGIDWSLGMVTDDPAEALEVVARLLAPKPPVEDLAPQPPAYAMARQVLSRFEPNPAASYAALEKVTDEQRKTAWSFTVRLEREALAHAAALRPRLARRERLLELRAEPGAAAVVPAEWSWLGHLAAFREDFRGVAAADAFAKEFDLDGVLGRHQSQAADLRAALESGAPPAELYRKVLDHLARCHLADDLPADLEARLRAWHAQGAAIGLTAADLARVALLDAWSAGWSDGLRAYRKIWAAPPS